MCYIMDEFKKKYPYADVGTFYIDADDHGHIRVFTRAGNLDMVSVNDPVFLRSEYAKWLTANKHKPKALGEHECPKIWDNTKSDQPLGLTNLVYPQDKNYHDTDINDQ